jgi:hypothetical protein
LDGTGAIVNVLAGNTRFRKPATLGIKPLKPLEHVLDGPGVVALRVFALSPCGPMREL